MRQAVSRTALIAPSLLSLLVALVPFVAQAQEKDSGLKVVPDGTWIRPSDLAEVGDYYALVIGVDTYKDFAPLRCAAGDAKAVADVLRADYGFKEVVLLLNEQATDKAIRDALYALRGKVQPRDSVLVYFSGHGASEGDGCWMPVNAGRDTDANHLLHPEVRSRVTASRMRARHVLVIADSCFATALLRDAEAPKVVTPAYLQEAMRKASRLCVVSSVPHPSPDRSGDGHSVFAAHLLKALRNPARDAFVPSDIFPALKANAVLNALKAEGQAATPAFGVLADAGHERGGEFVFLRRRPEPVKAEAASPASTAQRPAAAAVPASALKEPVDFDEGVRLQAEAEKARQANSTQAKALFETAAKRFEASAAAGDSPLRPYALLRQADCLEAAGKQAEALRVLDEAAKVGGATPAGQYALRKRTDIQNAMSPPPASVPVSAPAVAPAQPVAAVPASPATVPAAVPPSAQKVLDLGAGVKLGLAPIPVGEFTMGSPDGEKSRERNEGPAHAVRIAKPFLMGVCEVTQEQYQAVMGHNPSHFRTPKYPVEGVSWTEAQEFCRKLSQKTGEAVRLPTEAEWEYACRAGSVTPFHFGGTISTVQADYDGSGIYGDGRKGEWRRKTVPVGSFAANAFGLYDMHGNVWEWCGSAYKEYPYRADDGRENPAVTADRVTRGGGWAEDPRHCRSARRGREPQTRRSNGIGFRVVVDPK